ncbi:MAG TPA: hypothetical protein PK151_06950 [Caldisericia bacterium]|nr:hypothetical protein [Caldisericia bacterium]
MRKIGEIFDCNGVTLIASKPLKQYSCVGCYFDNDKLQIHNCERHRDDYDFTGSCSANDIIFKKWFPTIIEIEEN